MGHPPGNDDIDFFGVTHGDEGELNEESTCLVSEQPVGSSVCLYGFHWFIYALGSVPSLHIWHENKQTRGFDSGDAPSAEVMSLSRMGTRDELETSAGRTERHVWRRRRKLDIALIVE